MYKVVMQRKCFRADRSGRKFAVRSSEPTFGIKTVLSLLIRTFVYDEPSAILPNVWGLGTESPGTETGAGVISMLKMPNVR